MLIFMLKKYVRFYHLQDGITYTEHKLLRLLKFAVFLVRIKRASF
jgi:hypothetical protein